MATLPNATTSLGETALAVGSGLDTICVIAPVLSSPDGVPRLFGSAQAVIDQHDYCEGAEYTALHVQQTRRPVLFCGVPIATAGAVRVVSTAHSGNSVVTVAAGVNGALCEHHGKVRVVRGRESGSGTVAIEYSLDGGRQWKTVRFTASYTIPFAGVQISITAGSLFAGETIAEWHATAPRVNAEGLALAFEKLSESDHDVRSILLIGDVPDYELAAAFTAELNAYETACQRFVYGRASVPDRLPLAHSNDGEVRLRPGAGTITFAEVGGTGDTITRTSGSWLTEGFTSGDTIVIEGTGSNNIVGIATTVSTTVLTLDSTDLAAETIDGDAISVKGYPTLTFAEVGGTGDTITRSRGSWLADGFTSGDTVVIEGTTSNDGTAAVTTASTSTLTLGSYDLVAETTSFAGVSFEGGATKAAHLAAQETEFEDLDGEPRIDLSYARRRALSPLTQFFFRRPAAWAASLREYQHDLHVATWKKSLGPLQGFLAGEPEEWDDAKDGGGASAARFTSFRSWNRPRGSFISLSLTRAEESSLTSRTHNMAVIDLAMQVAQENAENAIGESLVLNPDGTASEASLRTIDMRVNAALELALLTDQRGEGPRASAAVWAASRSDVFNVPEPTLTWSMDLLLNGTIHNVVGTVRLRTAGQ